MILQILAIVFILFAASRVFLRFREKTLTTIEFIIWLFIWGIAALVVVLPYVSTFIAKVLGVGRGVDALIYISIIILFYGLFRIYVKLEFIEHELTLLVRKKALEDGKKEENEHSTRN
ncbi:MAG: DUF2304 family protein [Patescibacteria group bacterium]|jgi:hypothetical protein